VLPDFFIASFLVTCLAVFFSLNLLNLARTRSRKREKTVKTYAEVKRPEGVLFALAAFGTLLFFFESMIYPLLVFTGLLSIVQRFPLQIRFQLASHIQVIGMLLQAAGYMIFLWSVLERGRYSVAWEMAEDHKLVTSGPYRYVRHPSYMAYFLLFFGLFFISLNMLALIPLIAIPGYVNVTVYEEELLKRRFGDKYVEYQKTTGRVFPKIRRQ